MSQDQKAVLTTSQISDIQWFPDSRHIAALIDINGKRILAQIDTVTGTFDVINNGPEHIDDYSMDQNGDVFAVSVRATASHKTADVPVEMIEKGYRVVPSQTGYADPWPMREIRIIRKSADGRWDENGPVTFISPLSGKAFVSLKMGGGLDTSLSPNGKYLLVDNIETVEDLPKRWQASPYVKFLKSSFGGIVVVNYLYDLSTKQVTVPLESPLVREHAVWSRDSRFFARVALPPVGSAWETNDMDSGVANDHNTHLFTVDLGTGIVGEVLRRAERGPLLLTDAGDIFLRGRDGFIHVFARDGSRWAEKAQIKIPLSNLSPYSAMITDGTRFVGDYQDASTPPQLFAYSAKTAKVTVLVKLNPQVDNLLLPQVKRIQWKTSTGYQANGVMLLPPDYDPTKRYPLVIENGSILYNGTFACDAGVDHVSSFVRGMLADDGIMYLMRAWPGNNNWEKNFYPKGYPGGIAEAAFKLDLVESAIQYLDSQGMIDPGNVGLIGFSRGGWYTEYALTHSGIRFRAATVTDNVEYSYGEYWYFHSDRDFQLSEAMYGGPPYGKTLKNWQDYSISFNTQKVHTPLLMEVMGYGFKDDDPERPPNNLAVHFELFSALSRQKKPVEMYYYPNEQHQVEHPVARISSLQRNIDWFRFWLQGYERSNPEDSSQYKRWETMRKEVELKQPTQSSSDHGLVTQSPIGSK